MKEKDQSLTLQAQVKAALNNKTPLAIEGGNSKSFLGRKINIANKLDLSGHQGVVAYEPTELAITVRSGSKLKDVEELLLKNNQQFAFEPPAFGENATIGGMVAAGLSGPRRPYAGSVRDAVLGVKIINGKGEILEYGGRVMKNVAGYDVSRLMVGAMGTLGVLLEVSFKLQPKPQYSLTLSHTVSAETALKKMLGWRRKNTPVDATTWFDGNLYFRLSSSEQVVANAQKVLDGEVINHADNFWSEIKNQRHQFFTQEKNIWRLSLPATLASTHKTAKELIEWDGQQRWLADDIPASEIRQYAEDLGGHATLFRSERSQNEPFHPLPGMLLKLHQQLKAALDPESIFNPGRMYKEL